MPANWIEGIIQKLESPRKCFEFITDTAEVSRVATAISLNNCMPEGYVFAVLDDAGLVKYSGRSADTLINQPARGVEIDLDTVFIRSATEYGSPNSQKAYTSGGGSRSK
jgi:hypothetical protein